MTWEDVGGWLFDFQTIYDEALQRAPKSGAVFVEVGVWKGRTVAYLDQAARKLGKRVDIWAVDNWKGAPCDNLDEECHKMAATGNPLYAQFLENMRGCGADWVHSFPPGTFPDPVSSNAAAEFADQSCDLIFLDADHSYDAVKADALAWFPKLKPGGIFAGHDSNRDGVQRGVNDALAQLGAPGRFVIPVYANYSWLYEE